ncbi:unnamed protein product [Moneuplotes crassus]|uniref:HTH myb-type domain-containing protein n=1 Tax=Euplotes crassus TaxID=5936 RepID=A0AAD1YBF2_EUPCR|nr:unnamed protein product [Moneuplotes crassus]
MSDSPTNKGDKERSKDDKCNSEIGLTSNSPQSGIGRRSRKAKTTAEFKILGKKHSNNDGKTGRWSTQEHIRFLQGLIQHGKVWKLVQRHVNLSYEPTNKAQSLQRTGPQIRSHAQKFFKRIFPNCQPGENPIQCLKREKFSIDLIISGIEDTQEKLALKEELEVKLQDFPDCDCDQFISKKTKTSSVIKSDNSDCKSSKSFERKPTVEFENCEQQNEVRDTNSNEQSFTYFPATYKMATMGMTTPQSQPNQDSFKFEKSFDSYKKDSSSPCIQLSSENPKRNSLKRKHSEIVRLDKLERVDVPDFHMPTPVGQEDINKKTKINKREAKLLRRQRIMTETVQDFQGRVGFCPTKKSEQTLSSIEVLRNKNIPKPQIGSVMSLQKYSIDESGSVISASGKKAQVKLIKMNKDLNSNNHGFHRLRLQTF